MSNYVLTVCMALMIPALIGSILREMLDLFVRSSWKRLDTSFVLSSSLVCGYE